MGRLCVICISISEVPKNINNFIFMLGENKQASSIFTEHLSKQPPWGKNISNDITNLSNYFVTSDGEDFITIFFNALEKAKKMQMDLTIESV